MSSEEPSKDYRPLIRTLTPADQRLIEGYRLALEGGAKGGVTSVRTVQLYLLAARRWAAYCCEAGTDTRTADRAAALAYSAAMRATLRPGSVGVYLVATKVYANWLIEEGERADSPFDRISRPKKEQRGREPFTPEQVRLILGLHNRKTLIGLRNYALCQVLLDTMMRRSEAAAVRVEDIDPETRTIRIVGKGRKVRTVRIGATALRAVDQYLRRREAKLPGLPWLWHSQEGGGPLSSSGIGQLHATWTRRLGFPVRAHQWRHTGIQLMLDSGADREYVRLLAGHADMSTLRVYTEHSDQARALAAHETHSPADRLGRGRVRGTARKSA